MLRKEMSGMVSLAWAGHHDALIGVFEKLLEKSSFVDCTITAEGQNLKAHKEVLSAFSPFFELLFKEEIEHNPTVVLDGISFQDIRALIYFMYHGKVELPAERVKEFIEAGECLQIKGVGDGRKGQCSELADERSYVQETQDSTVIPNKRKRKHIDEDVLSASPSETNGNIESHSNVETSPQAVSEDVIIAQAKIQTPECDQTAQPKNQKSDVNHCAPLLCNFPKDVGLEIPDQAKQSSAGSACGLTGTRIQDLDHSSDQVDVVQPKNIVFENSGKKSDSAFVKDPNESVSRSDSYEGILSDSVPPSVSVNSASPGVSTQLKTTPSSRSCVTSSAISESSSSIPRSTASSVNCISPVAENQDTFFHSEVNVKSEPEDDEDDDDDVLLSENECVEEEAEEATGKMAAFETIYLSTATAEEDEKPDRLTRSSEFVMLNPVNILRLAMAVYEDRHVQSSPAYSREEYFMRDMIVRVLEDHMYHEDVAVETSETLDFVNHESPNEDNCEPVVDSEEESEHQSSGNDSDYFPSPKRENICIPTEKKLEAVIYWLNKGGKKRYKLSSVQKRYRFVKSERELYRWKKELISDGNKSQSEKKDSV